MLKKNILANFIGRFWGFISAFLFTPIYIHYLGIEGYSIISFALVIVGVMSILDAGLSMTLTREFALKNNSQKDKTNTLATFEIFYFAISLLVIIIIFTFSNQIANNWLNLDLIDPLKVSYYLKLIGVGIAFQLLGNFYMGGLMGLEKQVKGNLYRVGWGIARNALVVIPLMYRPSLELFFIWQTTTTIIYTFLLRRSLLNELNARLSIIRSFSIDEKILKRTWKFAGGIFLISLVASVNTQMDKISISKILPISVLGLYTLAISLSQVIVSLITPISTAIVPRFTSLFSENKRQEASLLYHKISTFISIIALSFGLNIIFFAKDLLWIWTGDLSLANSSYQFVPILTIGSIMLSFQILPYSIAMANGYTKLNNYLGIASLAITLPGYWLMTTYFGAIGAALTWGGVQTLITPFYNYLINKKFLPDITIKNQLFHYFFKPAIVAILITYLFSQFTYFSNSRIGEFLWIGISTLTTIIVSVFFLIDKNEYSKVLTKLKINKSNNND